MGQLVLSFLSRFSFPVFVIFGNDIIEAEILFAKKETELYFFLFHYPKILSNIFSVKMVKFEGKSIAHTSYRSNAVIIAIQYEFLSNNPLVFLFSY